ncbi:MAG: GNAT family N-acetyltransferase [Thermoproteota archaeon]|nr:GNAT family N-acetyltransferase [Candidatus Brockarchaeota archaeon]
MRVEIVSLTEENLIQAPEWGEHPFSCKYCIYWESPKECVDPSKEIREETLAKKLNWLRSVRTMFGECGKLLYVDGKPVGYAQYAPPETLPLSAEYSAGPPSRDAVLISCLFIAEKEYRGRGLGKLLLESIIEDLRKRGFKAVETFARRNNPNNPSGPVEFYLKNGFRVLREDPEFPLMRLEL